MSDGDIVPAARQRREGHRAPRSRQSAIGDRQLPWMQLRNVYRPMEIISADAVEAIHLASLKVLETTGISVQSDNVRALCVENGAELMGDGVRMRFDRGLIEAALATVPSAFTLSTRNPKRDVRIGDGYLVFSTVSGPPNCSDLVGGRRPGSMKDYEDFLRLAQEILIVRHRAWPTAAREVRAIRWPAHGRKGEVAVTDADVALRAGRERERGWHGGERLLDEPTVEPHPHAVAERLGAVLNAKRAQGVRLDGNAGGFEQLQGSEMDSLHGIRRDDLHMGRSSIFAQLLPRQLPVADRALPVASPTGVAALGHGGKRCRRQT